MITAIIAAAGQGNRMGLGYNKAFFTLFDEPMIMSTIKAVTACSQISSLVVVTDGDHVGTLKSLLDQVRLPIPYQVVEGASERQFSIAKALEVISDAPYILVHDGARPLIDVATIERAIEEVRRSGAAVVGVPVKDTVKIVDASYHVQQTPDRRFLWAVQTPQVFDASLLQRAYYQARKDDFVGTDDASLVERLGVKVTMVEGNYENIKVTTPSDCQVARAFKGNVFAIPRVGFGYDVHTFAENRRLILGGVDIPYSLGLLGHSDADVLLHAIEDALLGAASLGDIGKHFSDQDDAYKGISSLVLLEKVRDLVTNEGLKIVHVDATIVAQKPKLAPYITQMNENISRVLGLALHQVNVKATTTEGLGFTGRAEGIAAYATATVVG